MQELERILQNLNNDITRFMFDEPKVILDQLHRIDKEFYKDRSYLLKLVSLVVLEFMNSRNIKDVDNEIRDYLLKFVYDAFNQVSFIGIIETVVEKFYPNQLLTDDSKIISDIVKRAKKEPTLTPPNKDKVIVHDLSQFVTKGSIN